MSKNSLHNLQNIARENSPPPPPFQKMSRVAYENEDRFSIKKGSRVRAVIADNLEAGGVGECR